MLELALNYGFPAWNSLPCIPNSWCCPITVLTLTNAYATTALTISSTMWRQVSLLHYRVPRLKRPGQSQHHCVLSKGPGTEWALREYLFQELALLLQSRLKVTVAYPLCSSACWTAHSPFPYLSVFLGNASPSPSSGTGWITSLKAQCTCV